MNVSHVLTEEIVGLEEVADGTWSVYFGPVLLGRFVQSPLETRLSHRGAAKGMIRV